MCSNYMHYVMSCINLLTSVVLQDLVNIEMFLTAKEVEESLERQETATCLAWCHDNKSRLRKMKVSIICLTFQQMFVSSLRMTLNWVIYSVWRDFKYSTLFSPLQSCLEFSLRIQEFIELIRQNKRMDAVR